MHGTVVDDGGVRPPVVLFQPVSPDDEEAPLAFGLDLVEHTGTCLGPTTEIPPGDAAKEELMRLRVVNGFRPCHPDDVRSVHGLSREGLPNLRNGHPDLSGEYFVRSEGGYFLDEEVEREEEEEARAGVPVDLQDFRDSTVRFIRNHRLGKAQASRRLPEAA